MRHGGRLRHDGATVTSPTDLDLGRVRLAVVDEPDRRLVLLNAVHDYAHSISRAPLPDGDLVGRLPVAVAKS